MDKQPLDPHRITEAIKHLGGVIDRSDAEDGVDFTLDAMSGFAREREGRLRVSFFLALDPEPTHAEDFRGVHDDVPYGEVQLVHDAQGTFLRYLVELPFDKGGEIWAAGQTARNLHAAWTSQENGRGADLVMSLGNAGIAVPPLGMASQEHIHVYGPWAWGTRYVPPNALYMFDIPYVAQQLIEHGGFFALGHSGHGLNSYGLNLITASGPIAAYVQHAYGGVYTDPVQSLIDINATYARLRVLLQGCEELSTQPLRWLLVYSQFRGDNGLIDLDAVRAGQADEALTRFATESVTFEAIADRLGLSPEDFGTAGSVTW